MYVAIQAFELDERDPRHKRPFNPMINEGAIVTASLLKPDLEPADVNSLLLLSLSAMSLWFDDAPFDTLCLGGMHRGLTTYWMCGKGLQPMKVLALALTMLPTCQRCAMLIATSLWLTSWRFHLSCIIAQVEIKSCVFWFFDKLTGCRGIWNISEDWRGSKEPPPFLFSGIPTFADVF